MKNETKFKKGDRVTLVPPSDYSDRTPIHGKIMEGPCGASDCYGVQFDGDSKIYLEPAINLHAELQASSYTQGPLYVYALGGGVGPIVGYEVQAADGKTVSSYDIATNETAAQDAELHAAAPDLLAALKEVKAWSGRAFPANRVQPSFLPLLDAAILRATEGK